MNCLPVELLLEIYRYLTSSEILKLQRVSKIFPTPKLNLNLIMTSQSVKPTINSIDNQLEEYYNFDGEIYMQITNLDNLEELSKKYSNYVLIKDTIFIIGLDDCMIKTPFRHVVLRDLDIHSLLQLNRDIKALTITGVRKSTTLVSSDETNIHSLEYLRLHTDGTLLSESSISDIILLSCDKKSLKRLILDGPWLEIMFSNFRGESANWFYCNNSYDLEISL